MKRNVWGAKQAGSHAPSCIKEVQVRYQREPGTDPMKLKSQNFIIIAMIVLMPVGILIELWHRNKPADLRIDCKSWKGWEVMKSGQSQNGMTAGAVVGGPNGTFMRINNGEPKSPHTYITLGYVMEGVKPERDYRVRMWLQNDGESDPEIFLTTDPDWSSRLYWRFPDANSTTLAYTCKANRNGNLYIRLVMENKGSVKLDDVTVEEVK